MLWLTWRQHRKSVLGTLIGLTVLALLMLPSGLAMHDTFSKLRLDACVKTLGHASLVPAGSPDCGVAFSHFNQQYRTWSVVGILFVVIPLLVGLFWGAPLVARELDHGTHRLVWTQSVSRRRWALVKFGLVGGFVVIIAAFYGAAVAWWITPLNEAGESTRFQMIFFDMQGIAPIGYTLFAVALGVYAGTIWHRVLPAMAVTLGGFLAVRIVVTAFVRPHYLTARTLAFPVQGGSLEPNPASGDWVIDYGVRAASGHMLISNAEVGCPANATGPGAGAGTPCGSGFGGIGSGAYNWRLYQPGSRFWIFQSMETGLFVALAVVLLGLAVHQIRRTA